MDQSRTPVKHQIGTWEFYVSILTICMICQAEGKKRLKAIGKVDVPQEAFMAVLRLEKEVIWFPV